MLDVTLKFLMNEINKYLTKQPKILIDSMGLVIGNAARVFDHDASDDKFSLKNKSVISLVNIEEERIFKQQEAYRKVDSRVLYTEPPVKLNLYVLFVMNLNDPESGLNVLSCIIRFFQQQPVFTPFTHPALDPSIQQLNVELYSLNFEQSNQLWSTLGGKYLPSVLYKVRQVVIDANLIKADVGLITEIDINDRMLNPQTS